MTKAELIDLLDEFPDDTDVRLMTQQSYPFENALLGIWAGEDDEGRDRSRAKRPVVYLVEGDQLGYGTKKAWDEVMGL